MAIFGLRQDPATIQLNRALPNNSVVGLWLALLPLYLLYKLMGKSHIFPVFKEEGHESLADLITARTVYFDQILEKTLPQCEQLVILGAGLDTRCYGAFRQPHLTFFELDQANTQHLKRRALQEAQIDHAHVHFVEVDFSKDQWYEKLVTAGFDVQKRTLFLWEGVTLYLSKKDVQTTLNIIQQRSTPNSRVVLDVYAERFVQGELFPGMKKGLEVLKITDEEFGFGLPFAKGAPTTLASFVQEETLTLGAAHYMGAQTSKGTWMVVAEIIV